MSKRLTISLDYQKVELAPNETLPIFTAIAHEIIATLLKERSGQTFLTDITYQYHKELIRSVCNSNLNLEKV